MQLRQTFVCYDFSKFSFSVLLACSFRAYLTQEVCSCNINIFEYIVAVKILVPINIALGHSSGTAAITSNWQAFLERIQQSTCYGRIFAHV